MLCDLKPGDEVILPSFTFVSTASAFVRVGARPVFVDIRPDTLNIDEDRIEEAVTDRTRVIVPVHYAGIGCEMDRILAIARKHGLLVVEDAAQGVNSFYAGQALGSIGDLGAYSFHETKNYICRRRGRPVHQSARPGRAGRDHPRQGNQPPEILPRPGRQVHLGRPRLFLRPQRNRRRLSLRPARDDGGRSPTAAARFTSTIGGSSSRSRPRVCLQLPHTPEDCSANYHMFYVLTKDGPTRDALMQHLHKHGIGAVFHYVPLHSSPMGRRLGGSAASCRSRTR